MDAPIMDAGMAVREEKGSISDIQHLFTRAGKGICLPIEIEAEMLVPGEGSDYLDQPAEAKTTFLVYRLELKYRSPEGAITRPRIELITETLDYVKKGEALAHLPFKHSPGWRDSVVKGRRTSPYISTETQEDGSRVVKLHQDSSTGGGRTRLFQAEKLPRTVLSTVNAQESPTAVLARQEMLNWRLLQLEPSALRAPDGFDAPSQLAPSGAHLPATLYRLSQEQVSSDFENSARGEAFVHMIHTPGTAGARALAQIANRLYELIDHVGQVRIDRDDKRELLTLQDSARPHCRGTGPVSLSSAVRASRCGRRNPGAARYRDQGRCCRSARPPRPGSSRAHAGGVAPNRRASSPLCCGKSQRCNQSRHAGDRSPGGHPESQTGAS